MWALLTWLGACISCALLDGFIFLCVDRLCKVLLANCRTVAEKRDIWLFESLTLFGLSFGVFVYHHTPVLLWLLGVVTFISATLTGRVDFVFYWESLQNYWNEFSDQEESMQRPLQDDSNINSGPVYKNQVSEEQQREYLGRGGDIQIANDNAVSSTVGEGLKTLKYNEKKAKYELVVSAPSAFNRQPRLSNDNLKQNANLRRRDIGLPTASNIVTSVSPNKEPRATSILDSLETIGAKVWSVLGLHGGTPSGKDLPPGLSCLGRNLCFLNSILQCIARAPNLADELAEEVKSCRSQDRRRLALLDTVTETLQQINVMPSENTTPVVDTSNLYQAGSKVNPDLLCGDNSYQMQQDACELLTWLLYEIHEAINDVKGGKERCQHDESMSKLKTVYGNISEPLTKKMKEECKKQIAGASGLQDPEIAELVQNLSNLEWITHRRTNQSVVDDLFTFQCIELQMCSQCISTSANIQTMNVLSLPVVRRDSSVSLDECLHTFVAKERLFGRDGLQCLECQRKADCPVPETPGLQARRSLPRSQFNIAPLSPIQPEADNTVHYQAAQFLSSTPLPTNMTRQSAPISGAPPTKVITEGIRQCLLRRLPECLTIQLLRFNFDSLTKKVHKVHTPINVPLQDLNLNSVTYDSVVEREDMTGLSKTHLYSLYSIILHIGSDSTSSGHYFAYCKGINGCWYMFDDERVGVVQDMEAELKRAQLQENCYLLFYRKRHEESS